VANAAAQTNELPTIVPCRYSDSAAWPRSAGAGLIGRPPRLTALWTEGDERLHTSKAPSFRPAEHLCDPSDSLGWLSIANANAMPKWNAFDKRDQKKNPTAAGIRVYLIEDGRAVQKRVQPDDKQLA
jgi:hypothetical protein